MRRRAFTLIELLVVISIISLLIALVLPGLSRARRLSQRTTALAQLRQLGVGLLAYAQVNRDEFPAMFDREEKAFLGLSLLGRYDHLPEKIFVNPGGTDAPPQARTEDGRWVLAELDGGEIDNARAIGPGDIERIGWHCSYAYDNDVKRTNTGRIQVFVGDRGDYARGRTYSANWDGEGMCLLWTDAHAEFSKHKYVRDQADPNIYHHNEFGGEGGDEVTDDVAVVEGTLDTHLRFFSEEEDDALLPD